jgi:hypothetical protein
MSIGVEVLGKHELSVKIHRGAQDVLKMSERCGLGRTPEGRYQVIWPGLINHWLNCPEELGEYLGTLDRGSTLEDVEHLLEGEA